MRVAPLCLLPVVVLAGAVAGCGGGGAPSSAARDCRAFVRSWSETVDRGGPKERVRRFRELADRAPIAIRADFITIADVEAKILAARLNAKSGPVQNPAEIARIQHLMNVFGQPRVEAATRHVLTWLQRNCGR
jgi:hypothetical protein